MQGSDDSFVQTIEGALPETGNPALDSALETLSESVGGMIDSFVASLPKLAIAFVVLIACLFLASGVRRIVGKVTKALDDAGIEIPYPYLTLTMSKNEPDIINAVRGGAQSDDG